MNCWEFMKCGREKGGSRVPELGVCPAWPDHGHECANIVGTLCQGRAQNYSALKAMDCLDCKFYRSKYYRLKK